MCGIVGYIGNKKAVPVLINGLLSLEYRGYDSAGIAVLEENKKDYIINVVKDKGRVKNLQDNKELDKLLGTTGIAHTRWATHGYTLYSETDTEVIPNLISMYYDGDILKAVSKTMKELKGSYAIEVVSPLFPDKIIIAKKDSPLVVGIGKGENYIASDIPAVLSHTNNFYFLDEEEIAVVEKDAITFYNIDLKKVKKDIKNIEWDAESSEKNGYEDYMLKEIYEQPTAIRETIGSRLSLDKKVELGLEGIDFKKFNKIFIVACGTAMHAGIATKYALEKFCKISTEVDMASEFRYRDPLVDEHSLCIFISQSGETADTIAALRLAKSFGATTISVVNVIGSSITRLSDYTIYTHAGPEIAVASTKAYTCQVTLLNILAVNIAESLGYDSKELSKFKASLLELPEKVKVALETCDQVKSFAKKVYTEQDLYFIGRGLDYAVSMEGSLKLKEISYIHSEAYASGELKHGPIALIEKGVTVIGVATSPVTTEKTMSNLEEAITRGANVLVVTNQDIKNDKIDEMINIPDTDPFLSPIVSVIPLQLFAYYIAKNKKLDVDKPRNLAKSVTVE